MNKRDSFHFPRDIMMLSCSAFKLQNDLVILLFGVFVCDKSDWIRLMHRSRSIFLPGLFVNL